MIKLTGFDGKPLFVAAEHVTSIVSSIVTSPSEDPFKVGEKKEFTIVCCGDDSSTVTESPEEVTRKIMEYKVLLMQYQAYIRDEETYSYAHKAGDALKKLAGLEDSGHDQ